MKKYNSIILIATITLSLISCAGSTENPETNGKKDTASNQTKTKQTTMSPHKITPCLWVDKDAKAVVDYYLAIFKEGKMKDYRQYKNPPEAIAQGGQDKFETAIMEIGDIEFSILAAGPYFKFNESVSFVINCKDQAEVDYYWEALTKNGGEEGVCGWCKDKYGLSWQVVPVEYFDLINSEDPAVREKAMKNTLKQKKLILSELK